MHSRPICAAFSLPLLLIAACASEVPQQAENPDEFVHPEKAADKNGADGMASRDPPESHKGVSDGLSDLERRPIMQAQVVLERLGFAPGIIDGKAGLALTNAVAGYQEANDLPVTGKLDIATKKGLSRWADIPATRIVTIPQSWDEFEFETVPDGAQKQAAMAQLGYESMAEKLAERFHTTPGVLAQLNQDVVPSRKGSASQDEATYAAGQQVRVPNVGNDRIDTSLVDGTDWLATLQSLGVGTNQPIATRILVDESAGWLKVFDEGDNLVALFTVTTGSSQDPLPIGNWGITGIAYNPPFAYDPTLFWDVPDSEASQQLPPGPNGPVGVVWIDLTREHYGIHGTSAPETIGRAESHGCVRLTNWDAARLALMVGTKTKVVFQA
jgi:lipoprotein-anchoring transpeptidase ErfK/SrfK